MTETRLTYLDIAAGIMTIWVMVYHALYPSLGTDTLVVVPWLYYFMPWFFYKSGYMFHPKDIKTEYHKGLHKLVRTFVIWSIIGYLAHIGWLWFAGELTFRSAIYTPIRSLVLKAQVPINGALWFLPILFIVRIIGNYLIPKIHIYWIILGSFTISVIINIIGWRLMPTWLSGTAWGLFFFAVGYYLQGKESNRLIVIVATCLFIASLFTNIPSVYMSNQGLLWQILWYPACVAGCIIFDNFCRVMVSIPNRIHVATGGANGIIQYLHTSVAMQ